MTGEVTILPPEPWPVDTRPHSLIPTPAPVAEPLNFPLAPSGRWWVFLPGAGISRHWLNGNELQWPQGRWIAMEDKDWHVLYESDLPMRWMDGFEEMEKTVDRLTGSIGRRRLKTLPGGARQLERR